MSHCTECGKEMHPAEASEFYECELCRERKGCGERVPTLYDDTDEPDDEADDEDILTAEIIAAMEAGDWDEVERLQGEL